MSKKMSWDAAEVARKLRDMKVTDFAKPTPPIHQNQRYSSITGGRLAGGGNPPPRKNKITLATIWKK